MPLSCTRNRENISLLTVESIKVELSKLEPSAQREILDYLRDLDAQATSDDLRLQESIHDYQAGNTVSSEDVHKSLRGQIRPT